MTFPNQSDALKSGAVDAVVTAEPFVSRIVGAGAGSVAARYAADLQRTDPIIAYVGVARLGRKKSGGRQGVPRGDRGERQDRQRRSRQGGGGASAVHQNERSTSCKKNPPSLSKPDLKADDFSWWLEVMKQQGMLQGEVDKAKLVLP